MTSARPLWWALAVGSAVAPVVAIFTPRGELSAAAHLAALVLCVVALVFALRLPRSGTLPVIPVALLWTFLAYLGQVTVFERLPAPASGTYRSTEAAEGREVANIERGSLRFEGRPDERFHLSSEGGGWLRADRALVDTVCFHCPPVLWLTRSFPGDGLRIEDVSTGRTTLYERVR